MTYAFLDTSILMQYKVFEGMPWSDIVNDKDVIFVITQKVIDEVDLHKDGPRLRLRNRARVINRYLIGYLDNRPTSKLNVIFCPNPSKACTERCDFDQSSNDEYIIYSAFEYDSKNNRKVIISHDGGMKLRASKVNIDVIIPDSKYLLGEDPTEEEKELRKLKKELDRYANRKSAPIILFGNDSTTIELKHTPLPDFSHELELYREKIIVNNPSKEYNQNPILSKLGISLDPHRYANLIHSLNDSFPTQEDIYTFNSENLDYINKLCELQERKLYHNFVDTTIHEISLFVANRGTAKTGNLNIFIKFPHDLIVLNDYSFVSMDFTPPCKPKVQTQNDKILAEVVERQQLINDAVNRSVYGYMGTSSVCNHIEQSHWDLNSQISHKTDILIEPSILTHNLASNLFPNEKLYITSLNKGSFEIQWQIIDDSHIDPICGTLSVVIA